MTERRTRRKPGENWERLLQAGLHEFGLYGYQGTSTARIADLAGVPQPHLYANFKGKAELFLVCLDTALSQAPDRRTGMPGQQEAPPELVVFQAVAAIRDRDIGDEVRLRLDAARRELPSIVDDAVARSIRILLG